MNDTLDDLRVVTLHNGVATPTLSGVPSTTGSAGRIFRGFLPEQARRTLTLALDNGYRAFDGTNAYGTERMTVV